MKLPHQIRPWWGFLFQVMGESGAIARMARERRCSPSACPSRSTGAGGRFRPDLGPPRLALLWPLHLQCASGLHPFEIGDHGAEDHHVAAAVAEGLPPAVGHPLVAGVAANSRESARLAKGRESRIRIRAAGKRFWGNGACWPDWAIAWTLDAGHLTKPTPRRALRLALTGTLRHPPGLRSLVRTS